MLAESQRRMLTPAATAWIDEHLPADAIFWTDSVVIEHRFVATEPDGPVRRGPRRRRGRGVWANCGSDEDVVVPDVALSAEF